MEIVVLAVRLLLAVTFGVAGVAKAADLAGSSRAITGFGIPEGIATPLGRALPFVEIAIAFALIPSESAWAGAVAASVLLVLFVSAIGVSLARGRTPDCHCFGQLHSARVGLPTLLRNLSLLAAAVFIASRGQERTGLNILSWMKEMKTAEIVQLALTLTAVVLLVTGFVYLRRVLSQQTMLNDKIDAVKRVVDEDYAEAPVERREAAAPAEGLPIGAPAPEFSLTAVGGEQVSLDDLRKNGKPVLLLFVSPNCYPCESLFPVVRAWERDHDDKLVIALLSKGSPQDNRKLVDKYEAKYLLAQGGSTIADEYRAKWTPSAVVVGANGRIASELAFGGDAITELVEDTVSRRDRPTVAGNGAAGNGRRVMAELSRFKIGDPGPEFSIRDVTGRTVSSSDFLGDDTLLLFWDPSCPYCRRMSDDLERWELKPPRNAPRLVFVATGDAEKIEADSKKFASLYLYDDDFGIGPLFGTGSTPSAVLLDREGRVASSVALGMPNVLALAGIRKVELPIAPAS